MFETHTRAIPAGDIKALEEHLRNMQELYRLLNEMLVSLSSFLPEESITPLRQELDKMRKG